jgi:hypothetical protein
MSAAQEEYTPPAASIVIDGGNGTVLKASSPDLRCHPASLTKVMTLYLLFERLEAGELHLGDFLTASEHASEQAPSKLDLKPGQTITVEEAIKGIVTKSANDAAVVVAESLGRSEENFAKLMTQRARALGMANTTYVNASGLPDDGQVTTAKDQALLGRAIYERFPKYYKYFSTETFVYGGEVMRNHNHLLGAVEGVDGIKTGYTRTSGFNLITSVHRDNRHIIGQTGECVLHREVVRALLGRDASGDFAALQPEKAPGQCEQAKTKKRRQSERFVGFDDVLLSRNAWRVWKDVVFVSDQRGDEHQRQKEDAFPDDAPMARP